MLKATLLSAALGGAAEALHAGATAELSAPTKQNGEAPQHKRSPTRRSTGRRPALPESVQTPWTSGAEIWTTVAEGPKPESREDRSKDYTQHDGTPRFPIKVLNLFKYNPVFFDGEEVCLPLDDVTWHPNVSDLTNVISIAHGFDGNQDSLRSLRFKHVTGDAHSVKDLTVSQNECRQSKTKHGGVDMPQQQTFQWKTGDEISTLIDGSSRRIFTYTPVSFVNYGEMMCLPKESVQWNADVVEANKNLFGDLSVVNGSVNVRVDVKSLVFKLHEYGQISNLRFSTDGCGELKANTAALKAERALQKKFMAKWKGVVQKRKANHRGAAENSAAKKTG